MLSPIFRRLLTASLLSLIGASLSASPDATRRGSVVTERLASAVLRENRIGLDPNRTIKIYLPPGYADSTRAYPVVYFCHNLNWSAAQVFADGNMANLLERAFARGVIPEVIMVAADYSSPTLGSLYENSPTSGRWLDFTVGELVPFIDGKFRTLRHRDSRAVVGDFMGGRGALKLAMTHADVFGAVYALHPVATGAGYLPAYEIDVDWRRIHQAKRFSELAGPGRTQIFLAISQAFLPNPDRPPFYCDFLLELEDGELRFKPDNNRRLQKGFHLEETLDEAAAHLRSLRGIAFDWARHDPTQSHVLAAQLFTRKLLDLGIEHEAEEYQGNPWNRNWTPDGRFYSRVLPFLAKHLVFEP